MFSSVSMMNVCFLSIVGFTKFSFFRKMFPIDAVARSSAQNVYTGAALLIVCRTLLPCLEKIQCNNFIFAEFKGDESI